MLDCRDTRRPARGGVRSLPEATGSTAFKLRTASRALCAATFYSGGGEWARRLPGLLSHMPAALLGAGAWHALRPIAGAYAASRARD